MLPPSALFALFALCGLASLPLESLAQPAYLTADAAWWSVPLLLAASIVLPSPPHPPRRRIYPPAPYTYSITSESRCSIDGVSRRSSRAFLLAAFPQIKASGAAGQWALTVSTRATRNDTFTKVNCSTSIYGACPWQPTLTTMGDGQVMVSYKWKNASATKIKTFGGVAPSTIELYVSPILACFKNCSLTHSPLPLAAVLRRPCV